MTPSSRRFLITFIIALVSGALLSVIFFTPKGGTPNAPQEATDSAIQQPLSSEDESEAPATLDESSESESPTPQTGSDPETDSGEVTQEPSGEDASDENAAAGEASDDEVTSALEGLHASAPTTDVDQTVPGFTPATLGSLDPREAKMLVEFSNTGAGMSRITLSDVWDTVNSKRAADAHYKALTAGNANPPPLSDAELRYLLMDAQTISWTDSAGQLQLTEVPVMAAQSIIINGHVINLANAQSWAEIAPGSFQSDILDGQGNRVLSVKRTYTLAGNYEITLDQRLVNYTDLPLTITWRQYGPSDLYVDRSKYIDRRRFRIGYLFSPSRDPGRTEVQLNNEFLYERTTVQKNAGKARNGGKTPQEIKELLTFWPNEDSIEDGLELSSFASSNRYFALAIHPRLDEQGNGNRSLASVVQDIEFTSSNTDESLPSIFTYLYSPQYTIAPKSELSLDLGIYAGPQDRHILGKDPRYKALSLGGLILYQMSSMCAFCTWQWLASGLLWFLTLVNSVLLDWGIAIILLVLVVRTILHPVTKKSQVNMRLFSEQMQAMKPEIDKLQKKYPNDPKKLQQEQMRFMREHNMNPATAALGCMPMFLQMPIWVALYAMLYFAYDLRHEPAFYGIFQMINDWSFLADLASADHFFGEFATPKKFWFWNLTGINLLPILMGVIFWFQQKYMAPPPSPSMTKEQETQQKIMKIMMVVMFPLMLYSAPSGLTLYILTSTSIGIIESKYIRSHISEMEVNKAIGAAKGPDRATRRANKDKKPKGAQGRAYKEAMERAKQKAKDKRQGPDQKFKKRK